MHKTFPPFLLAVALLFAAGCDTTRSISNSGYQSRSYYNSAYRGELSEFDIIGGPSATNITETDIQQALESREPIRLQPGQPLLVIQSGAVTPDEEFLRAISFSFAAAPFSGQPSENMAGYSARLRLAAAQGGYKHLLCYWGILEASHEDHATQTISWIPIAGSFVPDQSQQMRIRLKAILLDVASGRWEMILPPPVSEDRRLSARINRETSDQQQVATLKQAGYHALAQAIAAKSLDGSR